MPDELSLAVVGARFDNQAQGKPTGSQTEILLCEPGEKVTLVPEPANRHDRNAIAVFSSREVRSATLSPIGRCIIHKAWEAAREVRAIFQEAIVGGAAIRVAFDRDPVLPLVKIADQPPVAQTASRGDAWDGIHELPPDD